MPKLYVGNRSNTAKKTKKLYIGNANNRAREVLKMYVGDANNKARLTYMRIPTKLTIYGAYQIGSGLTRNCYYNFVYDGVRYEVSYASEGKWEVTIPMRNTEEEIVFYDGTRSPHTYSKKVRIQAGVDQTIYIMPDGAVFWYGQRRTPIGYFDPPYVPIHGVSSSGYISYTAWLEGKTACYFCTPYGASDPSTNEGQIQFTIPSRYRGKLLWADITADSENITIGAGIPSDLTYSYYSPYENKTFGTTKTSGSTGALNILCNNYNGGAAYINALYFDEN